MRRYKPTLEETYYAVFVRYFGATVVEDRWREDLYDLMAYESGNCFKTPEDAEPLRQALQAVLDEHKKKLDDENEET